MNACPGEARGLQPHDAVHVGVRLEVPIPEAVGVAVVQNVYRCDQFGCPMRQEEWTQEAIDPEAALRAALEPRGMVAPGEVAAHVRQDAMLVGQCLRCGVNPAAGDRVTVFPSGAWHHRPCPGGEGDKQRLPRIGSLWKAMTEGTPMLPEEPDRRPYG